MTLSFIVPTKNEEKILAKMLTSVSTLSAVPYEIIVSDGGSTDQTVAVARTYTDKIVENTTGLKQNIAIGRNAGAAVATGEYLVFMDADVFIPDMNAFFVRAVELFKKDPKRVGLVPRLMVLPEYRTFADLFFHGLYNAWLFVSNNILRSPVSQGEFQMVAARAFREVGGYDEKLAASEDMELFMRLAAVGTSRMERSFVVFHTGRRAHAIGWGKMLGQWFVNGLSVKLFHRSVSKEWKVIR